MWACLHASWAFNATVQHGYGCRVQTTGPHCGGQLCALQRTRILDRIVGHNEDWKSTGAIEYVCPGSTKSTGANFPLPLWVRRLWLQVCQFRQHCCQKTATMLNEVSSFRQIRNKLNMFDLFQLCQKHEISQKKLVRNCCQKRQQCWSNIRLWIERTIFYYKLIRHCCRFW